MIRAIALNLKTAGMILTGCKFEYTQYVSQYDYFITFPSNFWAAETA
jgi:hypothetical protein